MNEKDAIIIDGIVNEIYSIGPVFCTDEDLERFRELHKSLGEYVDNARALALQGGNDELVDYHQLLLRRYDASSRFFRLVNLGRGFEIPV
jgi:hypothetical protein